ncbi:MAG: hypothetical protein KJT03_07910, partial [Verrucomicrobiae bacterium]|nr:hypothetical protein [Verrucomicrobiae bacterium]
MPHLLHTFNNLDEFMQSELLANLDQEQLKRLFACLMAEPPKLDKLQKEITDLLSSLDWARERKNVGKLVSNLLPFEKL